MGITVLYKTIVYIKYNDLHIILPWYALLHAWFSWYQQTSTRALLEYIDRRLFYIFLHFFTLEQCLLTKQHIYPIWGIILDVLSIWGTRSLLVSLFNVKHRSKLRNHYYAYPPLALMTQKGVTPNLRRPPFPLNIKYSVPHSTQNLI